MPARGHVAPVEPLLHRAEIGLESADHHVSRPFRTEGMSLFIRLGISGSL